MAETGTRVAYQCIDCRARATTRQEPLCCGDCGGEVRRIGWVKPGNPRARRKAS